MKRILIASDFSPHATRAMQHGVGFARLFDAEVELLTAFSFSALAYGPATFALPQGYVEQLETHARHEIDGLAAPLRQEGLTVSCSVMNEDPSTAICARAHASGADLVVLGTRGRHGLPHVLLGSVAERVARLAPCAVLTAHADSPEPGPIRKILLATDFSEDAAAALSWTEALIARTSAALILHHSVPPPFGVGEDEIAEDDAATRARMAESETRLRELGEAIDCKFEVATGRRHPETDALELAGERNADLIVVGTRGRHGLPHVVLGSTAERIIRRAVPPVVSVKRGH